MSVLDLCDQLGCPVSRDALRPRGRDFQFHRVGGGPLRWTRLRDRRLLPGGRWHQHVKQSPRRRGQHIAKRCRIHVRIVSERLPHIVEYGLGPRLHILSHASHTIS